MIVAGLDFETSGKLDPAHRIIEACVQRWDIDLDDPLKNRIIDTNTWRIDPERSIDAAAFAVHHISADDLKGKPNFTVIAPVLMEVLDSADLIVAHNGDGFDKPYLEMELKRVEYPLASFNRSKWFDTMLEGRWATTWGKVPLLRELCYACDADYNPDEAHAAEYDVRKMMECFVFGLRHKLFNVG